MKTVQLINLGKGMLIVGTVCLVIAVLTTWLAIQRWRAVSWMQRANEALAEGKLSEARQAAAEAVSLLPIASTVLFTADLGQAEDLDRLGRLGRDATVADRATVAAAVALGHALRNEAYADVEGGDARLLAALAAVRAGREPGELIAAGEEPPHRAVQQAVYPELLRHSWEHGDAEGVHRFGAAMLLITPESSQTPLVICVMTALTPASSDTDVLRRVSDVQSDLRERTALAVAALVPARRAALAVQYPKVLELAP